MANVPTDPPVSRTIDYGALVKKLLGDDFHKHEDVYRFSNGRKMESSDYGTQGIYGAAPTIVRSGTSTSASTWYINLGTAANGDADDYRNKAVTMVYSIGTGTAVGTATNTVGDFSIFTRSARFTAQQSDTMAVLGGTRTNLCLQSENLGTTWVNIRTSESTNATTAPDGATTADKLVEDVSGLSTRYIQQTISSTAEIHTFSVFLKAVERTWALVYIDAGGAGLFNCYFDLANGVVGTATNVTGSITPYPDGWYRCSITTNSVVNDGNNVVQVWLGEADNDIQYVGDGTSGLYVWGAQLEAAPFASSYIPTTTVAVERTSDVMTYSIST